MIPAPYYNNSKLLMLQSQKDGTEMTQPALNLETIEESLRKNESTPKK